MSATLPNGANHSFITPVTSFMPMAQPEGNHRGELIIGILHERPAGQRGREPKCLLLPTVAIGVKLQYTRLGMAPSLTQKRLVRVVNNVFELAPVALNVAAGEKRSLLTLSTLKRRCYSQDASPNTDTSNIIYSYMGSTYEDLDGNNAYQQWIYQRHIEADGLSNLINWLVGVVLDELATPGSAELHFANQSFTEREKRAFRIEIVGVKAMQQRIDSDDLDFIADATITPDAPTNVITANLFDGLDTGGPIYLNMNNTALTNSPTLVEEIFGVANDNDGMFQQAQTPLGTSSIDGGYTDIGQDTGSSSAMDPPEFDWDLEFEDITHE